MKLILQITAGILLALGLVFAANMATVYYIAHEAKIAMEETNARLQMKREQERLAEEKRLQIANSKKEFHAKGAKESARKKARFDKAWRAFYVPQKGCDAYQSDAHMVECINHKMRAKADFTKLYDSGAVTNT